LGVGEYDILCFSFLRFSLLAVQRVQEETAPAERDFRILDFLKWDISDDIEIELRSASFTGPRNQFLLCHDTFMCGAFYL
jgi:hypothetical protein